MYWSQVLHSCLTHTHGSLEEAAGRGTGFSRFDLFLRCCRGGGTVRSISGSFYCSGAPHRPRAPQTQFDHTYIFSHKASFMNVQRLSLPLYNHFSGVHKRRQALRQERILSFSGEQKCSATDSNRAAGIRSRAL